MKNIKRAGILSSIIMFSCVSDDEKVTQIHNVSSDQCESNFDEIVFNWLRTFAQVLDIAHKKHYKIDDLKESMVRAIDGFASTLDAHSAFLDTKTYQDMLKMMSGEFFGVGIVIDNMRKKKDKYLTVVDTVPDGPADKAGIMPMDRIVEVNGEILEGVSTEKIISQIKGERNSVVTVKVIRENSPDLLTFDLVRDVVKEQHSLSFHIKDYGISYLSLSMFTELAAKQIAQLLVKSQQHNYRGLILDLRNNSGGLLTAAIEIAGLFLKNGSLVAITKDNVGAETERYCTNRKPLANHQIPIFILINNYTASAAEILAGALKIHSDKTNDFLVFLVGTKTFGKGSVQEVIPVTNNCALKLTTHLYFLPDDTTIQGRGIDPDFVVERTSPPTEQVQWFTKHYGRESKLEHYIKVGGFDISEKQKSESQEVALSKKKHNRRYDRARDMLEKDNQLKDAIMLINMLKSAQLYTPHIVRTRQGALSYLQKNFVSNDALDIEEIKL